MANATGVPKKIARRNLSVSVIRSGIAREKANRAIITTNATSHQDAVRS